MGALRNAVEGTSVERNGAEIRAFDISTRRSLITICTVYPLLGPSFVGLHVIVWGSKRRAGTLFWENDGLQLSREIVVSK